jgi:hypothetical protein
MEFGGGAKEIGMELLRSGQVVGVIHLLYGTGI